MHWLYISTRESWKNTWICSGFFWPINMSKMRLNIKTGWFTRGFLSSTNLGVDRLLKITLLWSIFNVTKKHHLGSHIRLSLEGSCTKANTYRQRGSRLIKKKIMHMNSVLTIVFLKYKNDKWVGIQYNKCQIQIVGKFTQKILACLWRNWTI